MKKIIIVVALFIVSIGIGSIETVSAKSTYLINENYIEISYEDYDQLKLFGLTDEEIKELDYNSFLDFTSKEIIYSYKEEKHIETTYFFENNELVNQIDVVLTLNEMNDKVEQKKKEMIVSDVSINDLQNSHTASFDLVGVDGDTSVMSTNITETKLETTTYKSFYLYGVFYADEGTYGEFYVRTSLDWKLTPSHRLNDILTLSWNNNVQIKGKYYSSSGQDYPDVESFFAYTKYADSNYSSPTTTQERIEISGNQTSDYHYDLDNKEVGLDYVLPSDTYISYGQYYAVESHSNFYMQMTVMFTPTVSNLNSITFGSSYQHQISGGGINWGHISLSSTPPFFSYTITTSNDPIFDSGIGGLIIFDNIG